MLLKNNHLLWLAFNINDLAVLFKVGI